ncbi:uncharacterized protein E5676_scaffold205G001640 [Cucumis melo var. makuwa]|uniref:Uncharacterized protein n=1 Tax=Cucumis melo var. makuwa TaxID=1194695 RepID=A0A5D3DM55_CUCMM|nr:uncharacterized protein E6C27_scaffold6G00980 [Cucumis melo var. makuwa]TYK24379.1 uncharacterized protein E5676_scaffold205G001640 [Cucumis melo var. makuwa]
MLHQCFEFYKQRIIKVDVDIKPFLESESHFPDAKFYIKGDDISEVISTEVPVAKGTYKLEQRTITTKKPNEGDALHGRENDEPTVQAKFKVPENEKMAIPLEKASKPLVLRYIPLS